MSNRKSSSKKLQKVKRECIIQINIIQKIVNRIIHDELNNDQIPIFRIQQSLITKLFAELDNKWKQTSTELFKTKKNNMNLIKNPYIENSKRIIALYLFCASFIEIRGYITKIINHHYKSVSPINVQDVINELQTMQSWLYSKCLLHLFQGKYNYKVSTKKKFLRSKPLIPGFLLILSRPIRQDHWLSGVYGFKTICSPIITYLNQVAIEYQWPISCREVEYLYAIHG